MLMLCKSIYARLTPRVLHNASFAIVHPMVETLTDFAYFCYNRWIDLGFLMGDHSRRRSLQEWKGSWIWLNKNT